MADDIGRAGEDPRDVARRRLNVGRRAREAEAARRAGQASGPPMTPPTQSMVPYRENLPVEGGRGGPPAPMGGREVGMPRGENLPAVRREGMPAIRVPPGAADMMRSAMQSPAGRAIGGGGRAGAVRGMLQGAGRLGAALMRGGRSPAARMPGDEGGEGAPPAAAVEPARAPVPYPIYEEDMNDGYATNRPTAPQRRAAPRPAARESMTADDLNEIVLRLHRGEKPVTETEKRLADRMGIAYRKGGMVKPEAYKKGGLVKPKAAIIKSKAKSPANLKGKTLMKKGGMAKGGEAGLASGLRGGVVKKPGTDSFNFQAKKMATGGVVQKGGNKYGFTNAKTKMLRRGGMAKGCK